MDYGGPTCRQHRGPLRRCLLCLSLHRQRVAGTLNMFMVGHTRAGGRGGGSTAGLEVLAVGCVKADP